MNKHTSDWTEEKTAELVRLHGEGLTGPAIARALGLTRNAVNGKRKTLGLTRARSGGDLREERSVANRIRIRLSGAPVPGPLATELKDHGAEDGFTILQTTTGCRWPVAGDGADTRFCCRPKAKGSFCEAHAARAYVKPAKPAKPEERDNRRARRAA